MKTTRERYSGEFKAKVALRELAAKHGVPHMMIGAWERRAIDGMASTFSRSG